MFAVHLEHAEADERLELTFHVVSTAFALCGGFGGSYPGGKAGSAHDMPTSWM
ncbi:MAG: hypothetical protein AVDCRST_MAG93-756 [uncultured Chloroflexia bacterium]|uniref:Uncharacterized protein n=1 Tax=uncultured Chloroflexia bacterium TaxID=1672391 RepID=A0A6J4HMZ6_9CHLR|nr:MAG: hypothetical protein AVDCRST_MAG93-756 [uncultured Chloroflexia bacterium]